MRNRARTLLSAAAAVALAWTLTTPAAPAEWESTPEPEAERVIQSAPTGAEAEEAPGPETAAVPPAEARAIEDCTVTWYTADSCGQRASSGGGRDVRGGPGGDPAVFEGVGGPSRRAAGGASGDGYRGAGQLGGHLYAGL